MTATSPILAGSDAEFRAAHVGASEVSALFDCSPWLTHFELWHRKKGNIATPDFALDERMKWGVLLEPVILDEACRTYGWEPIETPKHLSNGKGLGGHPDRFVRRLSDSKILCVEAKAVDWLQFKKWGEAHEPPLHYLLQPQSYCGLGKVDGCAIVALVGGNQLEKHEEDFRPKLYAEIEARVVAFWQSIRDSKPPKPDYRRDGEALGELFSNPGDTLIDLRLDNRMPALLQEYLEAKEVEREAMHRVDAAKAEILEKLGNNAAAMVDGYSCRVPMVAGSPDRIITSAMVGETIKGRAPHRRFYVKEHN